MPVYRRNRRNYSGRSGYTVARSVRDPGTGRMGPPRKRVRSKAKNRTVNVPRNKLAFPQSISTKLRYVEKINMGSIGASSNVVQNQFIANGAYDPNFTGTGHQPRGFDQFNEYTTTSYCSNQNHLLV